MTIQPELLARYRKTEHWATLVLWIRLDQRAPGWWASITELAQDVGMHRSTVARALLALDKALLIRRCGRTNLGLWIWWVKRHEDDRPKAFDKPVWLIRDTSIPGHRPSRIAVGQLGRWAQERGIPRKTLNSWMTGQHRLLRHRWELVAAPGVPLLESDNAD